ncbi:hypothetical protein G7Y89_g7770 [Cudoniella acicularis]|uniref:Uncharacterized protein n=1 Tax=Cudoniella acicularis TaxID=354080 RepID=A0A8H4RLE7_9HELO|nr:hypothetical protein G7Y89_g7770 [Cudoniella acicularis]
MLVDDVSVRDARLREGVEGIDTRFFRLGRVIDSLGEVIDFMVGYSIAMPCPSRPRISNSTRGEPLST